MTKNLAHWLVKQRGLLSLMSLILVTGLTIGFKNLYFESDFRIFFADDNPQLIAHEEIQDTYTKTDNLMFVIAPGDGNVFSREALQVVYDVTDAAWNTPFSVRVDSLTNFQYSYADGDELIVEDLISDPDTLNAEEVDRIRHIALNEKQLVHRLISESGHVTAVNVSLELPPVIDKTADAETQRRQRIARDDSFPAVVAFGEQVRQAVLAEHPDYTIHLLGVPVINQSFNESSTHDASTLVPAMYLCIIVLLALFLRSLGSVVGIVILIGMATAATMGFAGWLGFPLNQVNITAPVIILTISVCDCVHLLVIYLRHLAAGENRLTAMRESLTINLQPIFLTSVTTAIGFLSLNFSDSPPFRELGTICAFGVMLAMLLTLTLLPGISTALVRKRKPSNSLQLRTDKIADFVIHHRGKIFVISLLIVAALVSQMPRNQLNDDTAEYFQEGVPLRDAADFYQANLSGFDVIAYSIDCGEAGCVNDPAFLQKIEAFGDWYLAQPEVAFVDTYIDVIKRLNRNMNRGDEAYYAVPESRELAAQYQLMYEMSLPYGLDLNNQINFDKSALRVMATIRDTKSRELIALEERVQDWFRQHHPELTTHGASIPLMFAHIGQNNIESMMTGSILALIGVTLTLLVALRSIRFGSISLLPNAFPAAMAFGIWGMTIAEVNLAVAVVFSVTLGIVVDDTVHFLSKYLRARREHGDAPEAAIRYAFSTVGSALLITTVVLALGFGILILSNFNVNAYMGAMTSMTIVIAVIFDFLFLPALLLLVDRRQPKRMQQAEATGR